MENQDTLLLLTLLLILTLVSLVYYIIKYSELKRRNKKNDETIDTVRNLRIRDSEKYKKDLESKNKSLEEYRRILDGKIIKNIIYVTHKQRPVRAARVKGIIKDGKVVDTEAFVRRKISGNFQNVRVYPKILLNN